MKISEIMFKQKQVDGSTLFRVLCTDLPERLKSQWLEQAASKGVFPKGEPSIILQGFLLDNGELIKRKIDGTILKEEERIIAYYRFDTEYAFFGFTADEYEEAKRQFIYICNNFSVPEASYVADMETYQHMYALELNQTKENIARYNEYSQYKINETIVNLIDVVEDFLERKGITPEDIPNSEREGDNPAIIYGDDFDELYQVFQNILGNE